MHKRQKHCVCLFSSGGVTASITVTWVRHLQGMMRCFLHVVLPFSDRPDGWGVERLHLLGMAACCSHSRGAEDPPSLPLSSLQLIDAGSLLPLSSPTQLHGSALSLGAAPVSGVPLGAAESSSAETGNILNSLTPPYLLPPPPFTPRPNKTTQSWQGGEGEKGFWAETLSWSPWRRQWTWPLEDHHTFMSLCSCTWDLSSFILQQLHFLRHHCIFFYVHLLREDFEDYFTTQTYWAVYNFTQGKFSSHLESYCTFY